MLLCNPTSFRMQFLYWLMLVLIVCVGAKKSKSKPRCGLCKDIVENFKKGLTTTSKSNYGGGNTKWEEKSLGSYAYSEVRLVEIIEHLCDDAPKECHSLLEEHEEMIENFWFKEFGQKKNDDLYEFLCIRNMEACCPKNTFGKECKPCPGGTEKPCGGNGNCEGAGDREGKGVCKCNTGYKGDLCNECKDGFYEWDNKDRLECKMCHISCKNTCWEAGPKGCDECKSGWLSNEELGCQDINECDEDPCDENQYCTNTQGSHTCFSCDPACVACTGSGPALCTECNAGYLLHEETNICDDVNECNDKSLCTEKNQECLNLPGSYECACKKGFHMKDGSCQRIPKEDEGVKEDDSDDDEIDTDDETDGAEANTENYLPRDMPKLEL